MQHKMLKINDNQKGFASIIIAIVLVTILSLITVGFAELMRHEQQSALNRQLSNAAYYAAESGINDASKALAEGYITPKNTCPPLPAGSTGGAAYLTNNIVDTTSRDIASYPCLLIDPAPLSLEFSSIGDQDDNAKVFVVTGIDPTDPNETAQKAIGSMTFSWQDENRLQNFAPSSWYNNGSAQFPTTSSWKTGNGIITGVLRVELVPLGSLDRSSLIANAYTAFLYPRNGSANNIQTYSYSGNTGNNAGVILDGQCNAANTPRYCGVTITSLGQTQYLVRIDSIYETSTVTVTAKDISGNQQLRLGGVQALADSTGKSQGVLRRLQARLPSGNHYFYPQFDLEGATGICKLLNVEPTGTNSSTGCP
ncbi:MAG TPA: pilus assembly PilX N-terminal domain-containing protein [Candidatus Dormibacteraeota bacterium]|nr:pilus assembly PilX N-terminal domain-containing protein [Candidatus Dormibacteraeota bacterium]